jgi:hypothetical protein
MTMLSGSLATWQGTMTHLELGPWALDQQRSIVLADGYLLSG